MPQADQPRDRNSADNGFYEQLFTRRQVIRRGAVATGALGIAALLAACGGSGGGSSGTGSTGTQASPAPVPTGGGKEIDSMAWVINGEAVAMDYALAYDFNTNCAVTNITEPLLRFDPSGKLLPNLATEWEQVDPLTLKLTLRDGVKFHDGSPMTAEDVAYSLNRHRNPDVGSYLATFHARVKDVVASGPLEVTVTMTKPDAVFLNAMGTMAGAVASKAFIEANGKKVGTPEVGIVGTGPYKYVSWTKGQEIILDRFDDYWNTDRARAVKRFVVKIILDEATIVQALTTGEVDGVFGTALSGKSVNALAATDSVAVFRAPSYQFHYLAINTQRKPFDDPRVRQALSYAIDKAGLLQSTWGGVGTLDNKSPAVPAMWTYEKDTFKAAYDALPVFDLDLDKAKQLIKDAGAEGAKGDILNALPFDAEQAVAIQAAAKEIGLDLTPRKAEITEKIAEEFSGKTTHQYAMTVTQWGSDIPDPAGNLFVLLHSKNLVTNNTGYSNPQVDALLDQQNDSVDPVVRAKALTDAQALIVADQPVVVFYTPDALMVLNKRLAGYQIRPLTYWDPFAADFSGNA
jgi:peptide/nickel transport system substrate-binding protein